jgi:hypothetical protein
VVGCSDWRPLQIADDGGGAQVRSAGRDQRLMHVQRDLDGAVDARDAQRRLIREQWPGSAGGDRRLDCLFRTAQLREAINALGQLSHDPFLSPAGLRRRSCRGKAFAI